MLCFGNKKDQSTISLCHSVLCVLRTVETVGVEISLAAMALSVVLGGVFLLSRRFMSDARRVSVD